jgi:hypothetical protein
MQKISGPGHFNNTFVAEDLVLGRQPTQITADWMNAIQGELVNIVLAAGLSLNPANNAQVLEALNYLIRNNLIMSLTSLDYPTICTATNKANVTTSIDAVGGKVTLAAADKIELGKAVGTNGVMMLDATTAFVSPSLAVSSTYYLRCMYVGDTLTFYVQKGTDSDAIPTGLVGTVNGASGGGFDSTVLDMLVAKIVTGTVGTIPTVTPLANAKNLEASITFPFTSSSQANQSATLTWARAPKIWLSNQYGSGNINSTTMEVDSITLFVTLTRSLLTINTAVGQVLLSNNTPAGACSSAATITIKA